MTIFRRNEGDSKLRPAWPSSGLEIDSEITSQSAIMKPTSYIDSASINFWEQLHSLLICWQGLSITSAAFSWRMIDDSFPNTPIDGEGPIGQPSSKASGPSARW